MTKHKIIQLAQNIISRESKRRPETEWIQTQADRLAESEGIKSRMELDCLLYEKMYARVPKKTDAVKIRYWRTGHHLPSGREEALAFAKALQLNRQAETYLLQTCMEKSDVVFDTPPKTGDALYPLYGKRRQLMEEMLAEYIAQIPPARIIQMDIPYSNLPAYARHLYCIDALSATALFDDAHKAELAKNHLSSNNYESEFLRTRNLLGEIPRRTMLRQIILLGIPYLNRRLVDERLQELGYLSLTPGHTNQRGALVDDLVIELLALYEECCAGKDPLTCRHWLFEQLRILDQYLLANGKEDYRFMYFRTLSTMAGYGDK